MHQTGILVFSYQAQYVSPWRSCRVRKAEHKVRAALSSPSDSRLQIISKASRQSSFESFTHTHTPPIMTPYMPPIVLKNVFKYGLPSCERAMYCSQSCIKYRFSRKYGKDSREVRPAATSTTQFSYQRLISGHSY